MSLEALIQKTKLIEGFAPIDITGAGANGNWISLKYGHQVAIVLNTGAWAAAAAVTVEEATNVAGAGGQGLAFTVMYTNAAAVATDTLLAVVVAGNTFNLAVANAMYVILIDASMLTVGGGYDCLRVVVATPGVAADLLSCTYIARDIRYGAGVPPSMLIN